MKKNIFSALSVLLLLWGCMTDEVKETTITPEYVVSFVANIESDGAPLPESKATMGVNPSGKLQTFWEDGDAVSVYSSGDVASGSTKTKTFYAFETQLSSPMTSAVFGYTGTDFAQGDKYIAIYPYSSSTREVNFGAKVISDSDSRMAYHMSQMDVPSSQMLVAGGFDRKAALAVAYSEDLETMNFKNAVALIKFRVADRDVISGCIKAEGAMISGRFKACVLADGEHEPVLTDYGKTTYSQVDFSLDGDVAFSTDAEYYVAVRPTEVENGFSIWLNDTFIKRYNLPEIKRNVIYNLGTLSVTQDSDEELLKSLTFDFTDAEAMAGWPTSEEPKGHDKDVPMEVTYTLDGVDYQFILANPREASGDAMPYYNAEKGALYMTTHRYLGFPVIEGYKLVKVVLDNRSLKDNRFVGVSSDIGKSTDDPTFVEGGEEVTTDKLANVYGSTFNLKNTEAGMQYYLKARGAQLYNSITLVYEKSGGTVVRVGTFNVRSADKEESDANNNWVNRRQRVIKAIQINNFDFFGVNEVTTDIAPYLTEQLKDKYELKYFNPYDGLSSKYAAQGLAYKKDKYTLSDWHVFYLSATPDRPSLNDGNQCRGGCCGVLTDKDSGIKIFVMVTHGALDDTARDTYAHICSDMEKKYNTKGYPSFFVGDMNADPAESATETYLKHWKDACLDAPANTGPKATFNSFNLSQDLDDDSRRIDYIYYRNAVPLNYVCDDTKYDGYWPSDHFPVYSDMKVQATAE